VVTDRDGGMTGFQSNNGNRGSHRGSGWHRNRRIKRLARLQHAEADDQELAHDRDNDLFGLEASVPRPLIPF
jgi:hypothetical protein